GIAENVAVRVKFIRAAVTDARAPAPGSEPAIIAAVGKSAVEVPDRALHNLAVARFVKVRADPQHIDVEDEGLVQVVIDPGIEIDVSGVAACRIPPVRAG